MQQMTENQMAVSSVDKVLANHIYEYKKGVRRMILFTCNRRFEQQACHRVLKPEAHFAIMVEVVDTDSKWTNVVEGMTAYTPEQLKTLLDDAGFTQTEIHRKKPSYATILGVKP